MGMDIPRCLIESRGRVGRDIDLTKYKSFCAGPGYTCSGINSSAVLERAFKQPRRIYTKHTICVEIRNNDSDYANKV